MMLLECYLTYKKQQNKKEAQKIPTFQLYVRTKDMPWFTEMKNKHGRDTSRVIIYKAKNYDALKIENETLKAGQSNND